MARSLGAPTRIRTAPAAGPAVLTYSILADLFGPPAERAFAVRLWGGSTESAAPTQVPPFTLVIRRPGALRRMFLPPSELALAQGYLRDDLDVEGDLEAAAGLAELAAQRLRSPAALARLLSQLRTLPANDLPGAASTPAAPGHLDRPPFDALGALRRFGLRHSRARDLAAVRYHYDVGNDFYALWLDRRMVYSCAYFPTGTEDLDAAQEAKLEHICRKLRLRPGERLLDIGCGWGGLVQHAAQRYGVEALGITLSEPQAVLARERIAAAGLAGRCRIEVRDYRDLPHGTVFDKVVSVGMMEHVGRTQLPRYFAEAHRLTRPGGLFLNHGIIRTNPASAAGPARRARQLLWREGAFLQQYVFPDSELLSLGENVLLAERAGFEPRDVENQREHYTLTLRQWLCRLEAQHDAAARLVGEPVYRVWRLYMAGGARSFATGSIGVVQMLLSRLDERGVTYLPLSRADLYGRPA